MHLTELTERHELTETEQRALACLLDAIEGGAPKINIRSVAQSAYVSTTTIIKLAKKMGYQGYSDMLYSLRRRIHTQADTVTGVDLQSVLAVVDEEAIEACVDDLYHCRDQCIFVAAAGLSSVAANYIVHRLIAIGMHAYDGSPFDMMRGLGRNSLTICLCKSGESRHMLDAAVRAHALGHTLYTMTASGESALSDVSERCFVIRSDCSAPFDVPDFFIPRTMILFEHMLSRLSLRLRNQAKA